jgi:hypothetical protein
MSVKIGDYVDVEDMPKTVGQISRFYPASVRNLRQSVFVEYPLGSVFQSYPPEPSYRRNMKHAMNAKYKNMNINDLREAEAIFDSLQVGDSVVPFYTGKVTRIVDDVVEVEYKNPMSLVPSRRASNVPPAPRNNVLVVPKVSLKPVPGSGANTRRRRNRRQSRKTRRARRSN